MTNLAETSVPSWIVNAVATPLDATGASYLLIHVGAAAHDILAQWRRDLSPHAVCVIEGTDADAVLGSLAAELNRSRVGVRMRVVGPAGACLTLRAEALRAGLEDDEISVVSVGDDSIGVYCTHCRAVTETGTYIGAEVRCTGCQRSLVVYHHVSRLKGQFMGYMADAEAIGT